jgi:uncharacterized phage-associated protein
MYTAQDIAEYFLYKAREDEDSITNMKVQKLLYYAQGFYLAIFDQPLFNDRIEKWVHGPVVPSVYREFKRYGSDCIPVPDGFDLEKYDVKTRELLDEVYQVYGQFSASALRNMTHNEPPWKETPDGISAEIDCNLLKVYFKTRLNN